MDVHVDPFRNFDSIDELKMEIESNYRHQNHHHEDLDSLHEYNWHNDIFSKQDKRFLHFRRTLNELKTKRSYVDHFIDVENKIFTSIKTFGHIMTFAMTTNCFWIRIC